MRRRNLPDDVLTVIKLAASCEVTTAVVAGSTAWDPAALKEAAELYLHQVLLFKGADNYRLLGVHPAATRSEMRLHMRWLMLWLHPDRQGSDWEVVYAGRVMAAWRALSSSPRIPQPSSSPTGKSRKSRSNRVYRPAWIARPLTASNRPRLAIRIAAMCLLILVLGAVLYAPLSAVAELVGWGAQSRNPALGAGTSASASDGVRIP